MDNRKWLPPFCELCGKCNNLSRHRITPGRDGGTYNRTNVIRLCRPCHDTADTGFFREDALRAIVNARIERMALLLPGLANGDDYAEEESSAIKDSADHQADEERHDAEGLDLQEVR